MKKLFFLTTLTIGSFFIQSADAQLRINIRANIGSQPVWGPSGYDYASYYYLPDIDVFYNVSRRQYVYQQQGRWIFSASLPMRYRSYNLYTGYKVVVNEARPYRNAAMYRNKYVPYKNQHSQENIRNSRDQKYYQIKGHPEHNNWNKNRKKRRG